jgi:hypothetical protein
MWKILSVRPYKGDEPDLLGFVELQYTPGEFDAPIRQTRGVKQGDGTYKNWDNVVITGKFSACFKSCGLKMSKDDKPYINIMGWETPRDGFVDLAADALAMLNGHRRSTARGSRADDLDKQVEALNADRTSGSARR